MGQRRDYYHNEHKRFPIEYFLIPIIFAAAIWGLWVGYQNFQTSRNAKTGIDAILKTIKTKDYAALNMLCKFDDSEKKSLELGAKPEDILRGAMSEAENLGVVITNYEIKNVKENNSTATATIGVTYNTKKLKDQKADWELTVFWDGGIWGKWYINTETLRKFTTPKKK